MIDLDVTARFPKARRNPWLSPWKWWQTLSTMPKSFQENYFGDNIIGWEDGNPVYWEPEEDLTSPDEGVAMVGESNGGPNWMEEILR